MNLRPINANHLAVLNDKILYWDSSPLSWGAILASGNLAVTIFISKYHIPPNRSHITEKQHMYCIYSIVT